MESSKAMGPDKCLAGCSRMPTLKSLISIHFHPYLTLIDRPTSLPWTSSVGLGEATLQDITSHGYLWPSVQSRRCHDNGLGFLSVVDCGQTWSKSSKYSGIQKLKCYEMLKSPTYPAEHYSSKKYMEMRFCVSRAAWGIIGLWALCLKIWDFCEFSSAPHCK